MHLEGINLELNLLIDTFSDLKTYCLWIMAVHFKMHVQY